MNIVIAAVVGLLVLLVLVRLLGGTAIRAFRVFVRGLWPH